MPIYHFISIIEGIVGALMKEECISFGKTDLPK